MGDTKQTSIEELTGDKLFESYISSLAEKEAKNHVKSEVGHVKSEVGALFWKWATVVIVGNIAFIIWLLGYIQNNLIDDITEKITEKINIPQVVADNAKEEIEKFESELRRSTKAASSASDSAIKAIGTVDQIGKDIQTRYKTINEEFKKLDESAIRLDALLKNDNFSEKVKKLSDLFDTAKDDDGKINIQNMADRILRIESARSRPRYVIAQQRKISTEHKKPGDTSEYLDAEYINAKAGDEFLVLVDGSAESSRFYYDIQCKNAKGIEGQSAMRTFNGSSDSWRSFSTFGMFTAEKDGPVNFNVKFLASDLVGPINVSRLTIIAVKLN